MSKNKDKTRKVSEVHLEKSLEAFFREHGNDSRGVNENAGAIANAMAVRAMEISSPQFLQFARRIEGSGQWKTDTLVFSSVPTEYPWDHAFRISMEGDDGGFLFIIRADQELNVFGERIKADEHRKETDDLREIENPEERKAAFAKRLITKMLSERNAGPAQFDGKIHKSPDRVTSVEKLSCVPFTTAGKRSRFDTEPDSAPKDLPEIIPVDMIDSRQAIIQYQNDSRENVISSDNVVRGGPSEPLKAVRWAVHALMKADRTLGTEFIKSITAENTKTKDAAYKDYSDGPSRLLNEIGLASVFRDGGAMFMDCEKTLRLFSEKSIETKMDAAFPELMELAEMLIEGGYDRPGNTFDCNDMRDEAIARDLDNGIREIWIRDQNRRYQIQITTDDEWPTQVGISAIHRDDEPSGTPIDHQIWRPLLWVEKKAQDETPEHVFKTKEDREFTTADLRAWQGLCYQSESIAHCLKMESQRQHTP